MAVTITHVFLWGSRATNHIENALMGSPWVKDSPLNKEFESLFYYCRFCALKFPSLD
jgi:hypothetical protein